MSLANKIGQVFRSKSGGEGNLFHVLVYFTIVQSEKGRQIHEQALAAQEKGEFLEALKLEDEAMIIYGEDDDGLGFSEIQAMRTLTYRHLYEQTGYEGYLIKAKHEALASVALAEFDGDEYSLAIPLVGLGRIMADLADFPHAAENFQRAVAILEMYPEGRHSRKSVIADYKVYLGVALYRAGDEAALSAAEEALEELAASTDASAYEKGVWLSGGHMKIAEAVNQADHEKATEHMRMAKKIIDSDEKLKLRLEQWNRLEERLRS